MTAVRIAVLENDIEQLGILVELVKSYPTADALDVVPCSSASDVQALVTGGRPIDILLTDIDLADNAPASGAASARFTHRARRPEPSSLHVPNGIDLVRRLFPAGSTQVIYVTGYDCYHTSVYETEHACFLLKPVAQEEMNRALDRAFARLREHAEEPLLVKTPEGECVVHPRRIAYVESDKRLLLIHTDTGVVKTYGRLADLAAKLPERFVQCHKSFLVNMDAVRLCRVDSFVLVSGDVLPISQSRRKSVHDAVRAYVRSAR